MTRLRTLGVAALLGLLGLVNPQPTAAQIVISPPPAGAVLILNPDTICLDNANQDVCLTRGGPGILTVSAVGLANNLDLDIDLETSATQIGFSSPAGAAGITLIGLDLAMGAGTQIVFNGGSILDGNTTDVIEQRNGTNAQTWRLFETFTDSLNNQGLSIDVGVTTLDEVRLIPFQLGSETDSVDLVLASLGATGNVELDSSNDILFQRNGFTSLTYIPGVSASAIALSFFNAPAGTLTAGTQESFRFQGSFTPASGTPTNRLVAIKPTINWGGTPGAGNYEALFIDVIETAIPTGTNYLARWQVDSSDIFTVTNLGDLTTGFGTRHDGYVITNSAEVQTTDATVTVLDALTLLDENAYQIEVLVVGVQSDGSNRASYHLAATVYRTGAGAATIQGSVTSLHTQESNASWDATFTVSGNDVRVSVTGVAATTIQWGSTLTYINMSS